MSILFKRTSNTIIEDEAAKRGDIIIFTAKFNAELAPIESAYREVAKVLREQNVVGTSRGAIIFSNFMMKKKEIRILEKKRLIIYPPRNSISQKFNSIDGRKEGQTGTPSFGDARKH